MARRLLPTWLLVSAVWALALGSRPCRADEPSASQRSIEKANAGLKLFEQGKWGEALGQFREADSLYHSPVFVLYAARSLKRADRWQEALRQYQKVTREVLPASAPAAWRKAQQEAEEELAELGRDMPTVVVVVVGGGAQTRVTLDGAQVVPHQPVTVDPGQHTLLASDGARHQSKTVTVKPGAGSLRIELRLPSAQVTRRGERHRREPPRGPYLPGLIVSGAGGALVLAGGVVGLVALKKASDAKADFPSTCDGNVCPESRRPEVESKADPALALGRVSTGLFIGGAVVLATGVVMLIADPRARPKETARRFDARFRF